MHAFLIALVLFAVEFVLAFVFAAAAKAVFGFAWEYVFGFAAVCSAVGFVLGYIVIGGLRGNTMTGFNWRRFWDGLSVALGFAALAFFCALAFAALAVNLLGWSWTVVFVMAGIAAFGVFIGVYSDVVDCPRKWGVD